MSIARRLGKNKAIVAIDMILAITIYVMLTRGIEFNNQIESLSEREQKGITTGSKNPVIYDGTERL